MTESGFPSWIAYDGTRDFNLDEVIDYPAALLDKDRHQRGYDAPGLRVFVVDETVDA
ncbi:MAG: hypothetical protein LBH13_06630 [Cellulomonadaceae bacterium]|jgi:hypothetical protein|nr:hypothetical protein [Cellulomonadaceae bacterium]